MASAVFCPITAVAMGMESCGSRYPPTKEHSVPSPCSKDLCWQSQGRLKRTFCNLGQLRKTWLGGAWGLQSVEICLEASFSWQSPLFHLEYSNIWGRWGQLLCMTLIQPLLCRSLMTSQDLTVSQRTLLVCSFYNHSVEPDGRDTGGSNLHPCWLMRKARHSPPETPSYRRDQLQTRRENQSTLSVRCACDKEKKKKKENNSKSRKKIHCANFSSIKNRLKKKSKSHLFCVNIRYCTLCFIKSRFATVVGVIFLERA